jgi:YHS domain-containing protein
MISKDLVSEMMVDEYNAKFASNVDKNKIYFCKAQYKQEFDKNPSEYRY